jgi:hypothetical protein
MLTRQEITKFAACAARLDKVDPWGPTMSRFRSLGLVLHSDDRGCELTPAGHDLLATVPHLPPEPAPIPAPACKRCNGDTEVPVFMGPLMMPCPACANEDGTPKTTIGRPSPSARISEYVAADPVRLGPTWIGLRVERGLERGLVSVPDCRACQIGDRLIMPGDPGTYRITEIVARGPVDTDVRVLPEDGWTLIDSEAVARSFVGARVEIDAGPSPRTGWGLHDAHGRVVEITWASASGLEFLQGQTGIDWASRGNVRLRRVGP